MAIVLGGNGAGPAEAMPILVWPTSPLQNKNSGESGDPNIQNWCIPPRIMGNHINCVLPYGYMNQKKWRECT